MKGFIKIRRIYAQGKKTFDEFIHICGPGIHYTDFGVSDIVGYIFSF